MAVEAVVSEAVSGRSCAGTGYSFGFRGYFEAKNDELLRYFCQLAVNSLQTEQGILRAERGIFPRLQGTPTAEQGTQRNQNCQSASNFDPVSNCNVDPFHPSS
jgi:hypothetical protein